MTEFGCRFAALWLSSPDVAVLTAGYVGCCTESKALVCPMQAFYRQLAICGLTSPCVDLVLVCGRASRHMKLEKSTKQRWLDICEISPRDGLTSTRYVFFLAVPMCLCRLRILVCKERKEKEETDEIKAIERVRI